MRRHVWVVEMKFKGISEWEPTVGCALTREDGRELRVEWKKRNPDDQFRLTKYEAVR